MFCVNCGREVHEGDNFCGFCGTKLNGAPVGEAGDISMQPPQAPQTPPTYSQANGVRVISTDDPIFRVKCEYCRCEFEYRLQHLGYRPWYPSGFVYCPKCKKPLRHKLEYEVK